jgi:hypothetical protein
VTKPLLIAEYLRIQARWRLDRAGADAMRSARCVVALIDVASYLRDLTEDDPDVLALTDSGCFLSGCFDPGEAGRSLVRRWHYDDQLTGEPRELLTALAAMGRSPDQPAGVPLHAFARDQPPGEFAGPGVTVNTLHLPT